MTDVPIVSKACASDRHRTCSLETCTCPCHPATDQLVRRNQQLEHESAVQLAEANRRIERMNVIEHLLDRAKALLQDVKG